MNHRLLLTSLLIISILGCYVTRSFSGMFDGCKEGYERVGNHICKKIKMPQHAEATYGISSNGNNWRCKRGYLLSADEERCDKIYLPYNAHLSNSTGVGWACDKGYRPSGKECLKVDIKLPALPENAHFTNDNKIECNYGYRHLGNGCVPN